VKKIQNKYKKRLQTYKGNVAKGLDIIKEAKRQMD